MILNLTQHVATPEQKAAGVVDLPQEKRQKLIALLTFEELPTRDEINRRASDIADLTDGYTTVMIGGASYLIPALQRELLWRSKRVLHAFTKRVVTETTDPSGAVVKTSVFKFEGFIEFV